MASSPTPPPLAVGADEDPASASPRPRHRHHHLLPPSLSSGSMALTVLSLLAAFTFSSLLAIASVYLYLKRKRQLQLPQQQPPPPPPPPAQKTMVKTKQQQQKKKKKKAKRLKLSSSDVAISQDFQKQYMLPAMIQAEEAQVFTFKQLQFATGNFSSANLIGPRGPYYSVYRGLLPDTNYTRPVAIKQLNRTSAGIPHSGELDREFRAEVDLLSRLHCPYLLELIGYCADQDHRLLVYEYMPNGNLKEHLHPDGSLPALDWGTRMKIALHIAHGLEYLHELVSPPVIHRDFKTSNILLDDDFNAKVSDFGLAKLGSDNINCQIYTRVLGTQGYVAPEYALTGHLTTKSDVYSFGVVLLELLTGLVPVDMRRPPGQGVLVSWALPRLTDRQKVEEMVDPSLRGQYTLKELIQVAAIAKMCIQPEADYRPFMTDVVQSLVPLVKHHANSRNLPSPLSHPHNHTSRSSSFQNLC